MRIAVTSTSPSLVGGWHSHPVITKETIEAGVTELRELLSTTGPAWLIVTSAHVFTILEEAGITIPDHVRIACVGQGTAKRAPRTDFVGPQPASAATFADAFDPGDLPMIFPASAGASGVIESLGATRINLYAPVIDTEAVAALVEWGPDVVVVTSPSAATAIASAWTIEYPRCIALGQPTAAALEEAGITPDATAPTPTLGGIAQCLERMS